MLDFQFTPAQEEYRGALRKLALEELLPLYRRGDEEGIYPKEQVKRVLRFAEEFWKGREHERDLISVGITAEEVARGDFNVVLTSLGPAYSGHFLGEARPELLERWSGLATGDQLVGLCLTEPGAGSDMAALQTSAAQRGDTFVIDGEKNSVSFLNADVFFVFARTDPESRGWRGISSFLIPRETPGLSFEPWDDLGCRSIPRGVLRLEHVEVPADWMVGPPGGAFAYTKERVVLGGPLAANQAVSFGVAEDLTRLEFARWQGYRVLWMRQNDIPCQDLGAMVKWYAPKTAADAVHRCLRFHGHYGYSKELPHQQRLRDIIGWQIGDGSEEVMKLLIARSRFGREVFDAPSSRGGAEGS